MRAACGRSSEAPKLKPNPNPNPKPLPQIQMRATALQLVARMELLVDETGRYERRRDKKQMIRRTNQNQNPQRQVSPVRAKRTRALERTAANGKKNGRRGEKTRGLPEGRRFEIKIFRGICARDRRNNCHHASKTGRKTKRRLLEHCININSQRTFEMSRRRRSSLSELCRVSAAGTQEMRQEATRCDAIRRDEYGSARLTYYFVA